MMKPLAVCAVIGVCVLGLGSQAGAMMFSLDDNPSAPLNSPAGFGLGAEDEFGTIGVNGGAGLAPSPDVLAGVAGKGDGTVFLPGLLVNAAPANYVDAMSVNKAWGNAGTSQPTPINLQFSVDRLAVGLPGTGVADQAGKHQQSGDIFTTTNYFVAPGLIAGTLGAGPAGFIGPVGGSVGPMFGNPANSNFLSINQDALGLTVPVGGAQILTGPATIADPPIMGSTDNVDAFSYGTFVNPRTGTAGQDFYFAVTPNEAAAMGPFSAADLFHVPVGGLVPSVWATSASIGLDLGVAGGGQLNSYSIDGLVVFDNDILGSAAQPGIDYALFSLAPGSAALAANGLSAAAIFFTDFTGHYGLYATAGELGLQGSDNVDALEIPAPGSLGAGLALLGLVGFAGKRRA